MTTAPRTPADCFATLIAWLSKAVITRGHFGLPQTLIGLIIDRLRGIGQRFATRAARIRAGRSFPRTAATPRRGPAKPRPPNPLPKKFGWLLPLVPDAISYRSQLENLFRDPEMAALMQAAPASLARPLRSLCHMLGLRPPPILPSPPAKPRPPREKKPRPKREPLPPHYPPTPPEAPAWMQGWPRSRRRWSFGRIRGSPGRL